LHRKKRQAFWIRIGMKYVTDPSAEACYRSQLFGAHSSSGGPMAVNIARRKFIAALGGAAAIGWPHDAVAQQSDKMRLIGVLMGGYESADAEGQTYFAAFLDALQGLGWIAGRNVRMEVRWLGDDAERVKAAAAELVAMAPEVIFCASTPVVAVTSRLTRTIPIVFAQVADPVSVGFVTSMARPGGNITGFSLYEPTIGGKWLEVLKEIAPRVSRVAVMILPEFASYVAMVHAAEAAATPLSVKVNAAGVHNAHEIEQAITTFASDADGGLIVTPSAITNGNHGLIAELAARHRLPGIYPYRYYVSSGGLVSYGANLTTEYHRAASYVDRILKGEKPGDLPIQQPTKFELVINLKTAKALSLTIPQTLLATADELIE
jgi:putative ABC transport system substrate-binding protein